MAAEPARPAIVVCGAPAGGKTTLGRALAVHLGAALLDQDVLTGPLVAVVARLMDQDDLDSPALAEATRRARYETVIAGAQDNLRAGRPVVLVAPFSVERRDAAAWGRLAQRLADAGGQPLLAWLSLPGAELLLRMRARAAARDRGKLSDGAGFLRRIDLGPPVAPHVAVDATAGLAEQCTQVLDAIS